MAEIKPDEVAAIVRASAERYGHRMSYRSAYHLLRRVRSEHYVAHVTAICRVLQDAAESLSMIGSRITGSDWYKELLQRSME